MWNLSKTYGARPSELLGVDDQLAALHLDAAVWRFGTELEEALNQEMNPPRQGKRSKPLTPAQQHVRAMDVLEKWLGVSGLKKYKDPALGTGKR